MLIGMMIEGREMTAPALATGAFRRSRPTQERAREATGKTSLADARRPAEEQGVRHPVPGSERDQARPLFVVPGKRDVHDNIPATARRMDALTSDGESLASMMRQRDGARRARSR